MVKVGSGIETAGNCDFHNGAVGILQQMCRLSDSFLDHILSRGKAVQFLEERGKIGPAQIRLSAKAGNAASKAIAMDGAVA